MIIPSKKDLTGILEEHVQHEFSNLGTILEILTSEQVPEGLKELFSSLNNSQIEWLKEYSSIMNDAKERGVLEAFSSLNPEPLLINPSVLNFFDCFRLKYKREISKFLWESKDLTKENKDRMRGVYVDKLHFYSIVSNPISNAIKYSKDRVVISELVEDESITLEISNDGEPISSDNLYLVRSGFETAGGVVSTNRKDVGNGFGLYISRYLSLLNGVKFDIRRYGTQEEDLFSGTQVSLKFPRYKK